LHGPDEHAGGSATAVLFEVELTFEGGEDRLDGLPQRLEELATGPLDLALAGSSQQLEPYLGEVGFEVAASPNRRSAPTYRAGRRPPTASPRRPAPGPPHQPPVDAAVSLR